MVATRCKALGRGTGFGLVEPGDPSNTISAAHSHGVFATAIPINDKATIWQGGGDSRNHDGSGNGLGIGKEGDPSPTLTSGDRHGVMCMNPWDAQSARVYDQDGVWHSLNANENGGMARYSVLCAGFKAGQGAQAGGIGYSEEVSPMLGAAPSGTNQTPAVVALGMSHACDVIRDCGEVAPGLQARMGTGGNQVPLTYGIGNGQSNEAGIMAEEVSQTLNTIDRPAVIAFDTTQITSKQNGSIPDFGKPCHTLNANAHAPCVFLDMSNACDVIRDCGEVSPSLQARMGTGGNQVPLTYGIGNGQANEASIMAEEVSQTLNTMHDAQAVMCEDVSHALRAKANCAYREDAETYPVQNMMARRLTPMEYERLQGFPDHWTDIGEWTDEKGKKHKDADSPRYKALGNSIALPFWDWMLRRMARYLPEGATLGSLFDGIAGFPLIWERIHGKGTARWASEIEPFPIAVTKRWFGDE